MEPDPARLVDPDPPFFFLKPATALVSGGGSVPYPPNTRLLHHEVELVVAIGRRGWRLDPAAALEHVLGYGVGLDLTRRDRQAEAKQKGRPWTLAKGFDRSAPCSSLVSAAEIGHPGAGRITARVNGEIRQDADLSDQIWNVGQVIAALSQEVEVLPGDLLFTGTPAGVGSLEVGDTIVGEIDGVGSVEVRIVPPR
jgi:fumarylpyruvate hydrolase